MFEYVGGGGREEGGDQVEEDDRARTGGGVAVLAIMHGRSRTATDPSHPYDAGTEHVGGFQPPDKTLLACAKREAKREVFGESQEG